jgi:hypothetical protein
MYLLFIIWIPGSMYLYARVVDAPQITSISLTISMSIGIGISYLLDRQSRASLIDETLFASTMIGFAVGIVGTLGYLYVYTDELSV